MTKRLLVVLSAFSILCSFSNKCLACGGGFRSCRVSPKIHFTVKTKRSSTKRQTVVKKTIENSVRGNSTNSVTQGTQNIRSGKIGVTHDSIRTMYGTKPIRKMVENSK